VSLLKIYHKGFNYSQDGPGNRLVYHMQGCNFKCKWCSNYDSIPFDSPDAFEMTPDEILNEVMRSKMIFFSGGGVTFTGGEPTVQFEELKKTLILLKENGISTCIENNGSSPRLKELSDYIDFLIMDLKIVDEKKHMYYTGASNSRTLENIRYFSKIGRQLHLRIPMINGINDDSHEFIDFLKPLNYKNLTLEVLKYHEYGKEKWGDKYEIKNGFVSDEQFNDFRNELIKSGIQIADY